MDFLNSQLNGIIQPNLFGTFVNYHLNLKPFEFEWRFEAFLLQAFKASNSTQSKDH